MWLYFLCAILFYDYISSDLTGQWKRSTTASFTIPNISQHWWDLDGNIQWVEDVFPTDVEDILLHEEYLDKNDGESDNDDEEDYYLKNIGSY